MINIKIINKEKFLDMCDDIGDLETFQTCLRDNIVVTDDIVNYIDSLEDGEMIEIRKDY